jgi:hypothetical protein
MKHIKIYEVFNENKIKIGDILKRKSLDGIHYDLSLVTYTTDNSRAIQIYDFSTTRLDFDIIHFYTSKSPHDLNRFFINEYSLLNENETDLLFNAINRNDDNYYFENIKKLTKIDLRECVINRSANKYNI